MQLLSFSTNINLTEYPLPPPICISTTIIFIKRWHWTRRCWNNSQPSVSAFIRCYRPPSQSRLLLIFPGHIRPHSRWRITRPFLLYLYLCICVFARSLLNGSIFYFWQGVIRYTRTRNPLNNGTPKILSTDALTHNRSCFEFFRPPQLEQKYFELNDMMLTERCPVMLFNQANHLLFASIRSLDGGKPIHRNYSLERVIALL